jgi:hypothetical protein
MEEEGRTILRGGGRGNAAVQKLAQRYERMAPSSLSLLELIAKRAIRRSG